MSGQTTKYDIEAMLQAYRENLRQQMDMDGEPDEQRKIAYTVHTMFQEPAMRFIYERFNAGEDDLLRIGLHLSVAIATALQTLVSHVPDEDQEVAIGVMMNNIYASAHRLIAAARAMKDDPDRRIVPSDFTVPVN